MPVLQPTDFQNLTTQITEEELASRVLCNKVFNSTNSAQLLEILKGGSLDRRYYEGEMTFCRCSFKELDLHRKEIHRNIRFEECLFEGKVNCQKTIFHKETIFKRCVFMGDVNFDEAILGDFSDFREIHLLNEAVFSCIGKRGIPFEYRDYSKLLFDNAVFEGAVKFSFYNFPQYTSFTEATFSSYFAFDCSHFSSGTSFQDTRWNCVKNDSLDTIQLFLCFKMLRIALQEARNTGIVFNNIQKIENDLDARTAGDVDLESEIGKIFTSDNIPVLPEGKTYIKKSAWLHYSGWDKNTYNVMTSRNPDYFVKLNIGNTQYLELDPLQAWVMKH